MSENSEQNSPRSTVAEYVEALRVGSTERLEAIFHPNALMAGYFQGEFYIADIRQCCRISPALITDGQSYV